MKKNETFKTGDELISWLMFRETGNPYLAQGLVRERNAQREKQEERML